MATPPRSEPLLWIQLLGAGLLPLELLLLLLLLAGSDPGPVPALERLLCWGLGAVAPSLLLWNRPADVWSLLLVQTPLRARRPLQMQLSRLQQDLLPKLMLLVAGMAALPLLWWLDEHATMAGPYGLLAESPRLVALLLASLLLAVMVWQWQQLVQSLWLLSRSTASLETVSPMEPRELEEQRLCLGIPLLLLQPLILDRPAKPDHNDGEWAAAEQAPAEPTVATGGTDSVTQPAGDTAPDPSTPPESPPDFSMPPGAEAEAQVSAADTTEGQAVEELSEAPSLHSDGEAAEAPADIPAQDADSIATVTGAVTVAVEPEQASEDQQGTDLDQQIL